ncbi:oligopeptide/dipeptide ABC transporter ATP-binding protein [Rathayibacter sp. VKM Ac-2760]|uniref:ABC transporter ATP-binding protein n=1 Tax=Rathayibacter sp. VKM Ac-2760 TaxID=2609253 RepID=UPI001318A0B2|nr:oligopeptide/dipeptide ABC transporter ATP-binding protein [Rathayibacter sp. VKM Ac-2760]QHC60398.1 ATP-binding cassette domain-containing protein [Rathayibacter sp. VKM Ac-2760]
MALQAQPALAARPVLQVDGLRKEYRMRGVGEHRTLTAVDGVSFTVSAGETVALVGESGSGKSTIARCITRLTDPTSGTVVVDGTAVSSLPKRRLSGVYSTLQMVFQDPTSSLNPRRSVAATLDEPLRLHTTMTAKERADRVRELLRDVELSEQLADRLPRQLSGGQRQRLGIARALAVDPKVILLDEPTASLDVSIRGQIIALLERLQDELGLAYLFISHDLGVVRKISDRVLVMYLGGIVEEGPTAEVFARPAHPYTRSLLSAAPVVEYGRERRRLPLVGEMPSPLNVPAGCRLVGRCPLAVDSCTTARPPLLELGGDHRAACPVTVGSVPAVA